MAKYPEFDQKRAEIHVKNRITDSIVTEAELAEKSQLYVIKLLPEMTFLHFISLLEFYLSDFVRLWLVAYPESLVKKELKFDQVLNASSREEIIQSVVEKTVVDLAYGKVSDLFSFIETRTKLGCPNKTQIGQITEMKATRDLLVHNNSVANDLYRSKSGALAKFEVGESVEIREAYLNECWKLIKLVVSEMSESALKKIEEKS